MEKTIYVVSLEDPKEITEQVSDRPLVGEGNSNFQILIQHI